MIKMIKLDGPHYVPVELIEHFKIRTLTSGRCVLVAIPPFGHALPGPSLMPGEERVAHAIRGNIKEVEAILATILEQMNDDTTHLIIVPEEEWRDAPR